MKTFSWSKLRKGCFIYVFLDLFPEIRMHLFQVGGHGINMVYWSNLADTLLICPSDRWMAGSLDVGPPFTVLTRVWLSWAVCLYQHNIHSRWVLKISTDLQCWSGGTGGLDERSLIEVMRCFGDTSRCLRQGSFTSPCLLLSSCQNVLPCMLSSYNN